MIRFDRSLPAGRPADRTLPSRRLAASRRGGPQGRRLVLLVLALLLGFAASHPAGANSSPRKLGRGLANLTTGVIVIPAKVIETTRAHGPFVGSTWGLAKGFGWFAATEAVGLFEFLTCPFETPPDFKPILTPEFPWGHYEDPAKRQAREPKKRKSVFTRDR